jgi:hypothetical protein
MAKRLLSVQKIVNLSSDPATGSAGELYYNTTTNAFKYYNGTAWSEIQGGGGAEVTVSETAPVSPSIGDLWYNSSVAKLFIYYDSTWVEAGGGGGSGGASTIADLDDVSISSLADNNILSYASTTLLWKNQGLAAAIQEVDGSGSGIDADLLDGQHASYFLNTSSSAQTKAGDLTISGNLTVNGTTTTLDTTTLVVEDKNIELGVVTSPTDTTADGGGITLKGSTDKTFNWVDATDAWTSSEHLNIVSGKSYYINGVSVLSSTAIGSGVTSSSLTSVGTIGTGVWQGSVIGATYIDSAIARLASPTFTGTPAAPNAAVDTNTTQIATTAFVVGQGYLKSATASLTYAPLASPTFTGTVTADTLDLTTAATTTNATSYWVETGSDGVVRPKTIANVRTEIVTTSAVNSAAATTVGIITSGTWQGSEISTTYTAAKVTSVNGSTGAVTGLAVTSGKLSQFAATTSSELAGVISDETGTGALVFANSPVFAGTPTAPTPPSTSDNNTIATTAFVNAAVGTREVIPLDNISSDFDSKKIRFIPKYDNEVVQFTNPYELILMINGIIQKVDHPDVVWQSGIPREGFFLDWEGYIQFSEAPPAGSTFDARLFPVGNKDNSLYYPFSAVDIFLGA